MRIRILSTGKIIVADSAFANLAHENDWEAVAEPSAYALTLDLSADKQRAAVAEDVTFTATLKVFGTDITAPVTDAFGVPIENDAGQIVMVKAVSFTDGAGSLTMAFDKSGFYRITETGINRSLPAGQRIAFPQSFEIVILE